MENLIKAVYACLPVIFDESGKIVYEDLESVINFAIHSGVHGLVTMDLNSEYFTLLDDERQAIVEFVLRTVDGRVPVVVSVTDTNTFGCIRWAKHAEACGAAAVLAMPNFFLTQSTEKICQLFAALDCEVSIPIMLHSAPAFHGDSIDPLLQRQIIADSRNIHYVRTEYYEAQEFLSKSLKAMADLPSGKFLGAAIGQNCATMFHDYLRGATIFMPSCEYADLYVSLYNLLEAGNLDEAYALYEQMAPIILMEVNYFRDAMKHILKWRGITNNTGIREEYVLRYDKYSFDTLREGLDRVRPLLTIK
jgi:4-hydroxy-tetrahydrodipicolinate synthase